MIRMIMMIIMMTIRLMMMRTDNSICSDAAGHTSHGKKRGVGHIGVGGKGAQRGRLSEKGGKVREKKSRRNNQSDGRRRGRGGGEKKRRRGRKGSLRMMGDQPPGLVRPYGNDVVGHHDQVNSSSISSSPLVLIFLVLICIVLILCFDIHLCNTMTRKISSSWVVSTPL